MAKPTPNDKPKKKGALSILFMPVTCAWNIITYLLFSILIGITIEWSGMALGFWTEGHAQQVLTAEFAYLNNFSTTVFGMSAKKVSLIVIQTLNSFLYGTQGETTGVMLVITWLKSLWNGSVPYINAAIFVIMVTAVRCVITSLSVMLFAIVGIAAMVDGLHVRELRKVGGDDEHGDVYHYAKASVPKIIILSPMIYLAWPETINPNFILLPGMILFFIAIFQMFAKYKKVL